MVESASACSCVWGSKGDFDSIAAFSEVEDCMACYVGLQRQNLRPFLGCLADWMGRYEGG
jgi:hypothetical protein